MKLSKERIQQLKDWIDLKNKSLQKTICPFHATSEHFYPLPRHSEQSFCISSKRFSEKNVFHICKTAFPDIPKTDYKVCPCHCYPIRNVIKKVKQIIETGEV